MCEIMAISTQSYQILVAISATVASEFLMMNLKPISTAAVLAFPSVSRQDLQTERCVGLDI